MVAGDIGVTVMPALARAMLPPSLVIIPVDPVYERTLTFTGPSSRPWNPLVEVLRDLCTEHPVGSNGLARTTGSPPRTARS